MQPSFGVAGTKTAKYCAQHAPHGMVDVCSKKGKTENCRRSRRLERPVQKRWSTVRSTPRTGWLMSTGRSSRPKVAARGHRLERPVQKQRNIVLSTPRTECSTSAAKSAKPKAVARGRRLEWPVQKKYCAQHAPDGMVTLCRRKCRIEGCGKISSFGVTGPKTAKYCAQHAPHGMVDVNRKKCRTEGYGKQPKFGVAGTKRWSTVHSTPRTGW